MDGLLTLLSLCAVMAVASFLAGVLPLVLNLSSKRLRLISTLGMGVLVGTSLIVIIPEGVDTLYSSSSMPHAHSKRSDVSKSGPIKIHGENIPGRVFDPNVDLEGPGIVIPDSSSLPPPYTPSTPNSVSSTDVTIPQSPEPEEHSKHEQAHHAWIGIALTSGFILMFLIDKLPQCANVSKPSGHKHHISLNNLGQRFNLTTRGRQDEAETFLEASPPQEHNESRGSATTIGLVIHAIADGIALGASSSTSNTGLSFLIFFAIMIHKAPAAFGLTSVLLQQGLSKRATRAHLVLFSLAAPAGAVLTWFLVRLVGGGVLSSQQHSQWWTGMLLLFSGGTFLYVAMHSMEDMTSRDQKHEPGMNGHASRNMSIGESAHREDKLSVRDLGVACFGMILPLFLQIGHAH